MAGPHEPHRKSEVRQRQHVAAVRLLPDEEVQVKNRAAELGITVAELLRRALLRELHAS